MTYSLPADVGGGGVKKYESTLLQPLTIKLQTDMFRSFILLLIPTYMVIVIFHFLLHPSSSRHQLFNQSIFIDNIVGIQLTNAYINETKHIHTLIQT